MEFPAVKERWKKGRTDDWAVDWSRDQRTGIVMRRGMNMSGSREAEEKWKLFRMQNRGNGKRLKENL